MQQRSLLGVTNYLTKPRLQSPLLFSVAEKTEKQDGSYLACLPRVGFLTFCENLFHRVKTFIPEYVITLKTSVLFGNCPNYGWVSTHEINGDILYFYWDCLQVTSNHVGAETENDG